ncbi:MAG: hypothetical protein ACMZI0_00100 [Symbiopectobacterium sp.]|uniref:hypothetical protein n=1 Tax=Symbiopectobacterium sp. TaxID=2952789 RepID=UPI0039E77B09
MTTVINTDFPRPNADQLAAFKTASTALIYQAVGQRGALNSAIKPLRSGFRLLGAAFTAAGFPGDNLTVAGVEISPGDVIVGDDDGVIAIPYALLDDTIARLRQLQEEKTRLLHRFSSTAPPEDWQALKAWE